MRTRRGRLRLVIANLKGIREFFFFSMRFFPSVGLLIVGTITFIRTGAGSRGERNETSGGRACVTRLPTISFIFII